MIVFCKGTLVYRDAISNDTNLWPSSNSSCGIFLIWVTASKESLIVFSLLVSGLINLLIFSCAIMQGSCRTTIDQNDGGFKNSLCVLVSQDLSLLLSFVGRFFDISLQKFLCVPLVYKYYCCKELSFLNFRFPATIRRLVWPENILLSEFL